MPFASVGGSSKQWCVNTKHRTPGDHYTPWKQISNTQLLAASTGLHPPQHKHTHTKYTRVCVPESLMPCLFCAEAELTWSWVAVSCEMLQIYTDAIGFSISVSAVKALKLRLEGK